MVAVIAKDKLLRVIKKTKLTIAEKSTQFSNRLTEGNQSYTCREK